MIRHESSQELARIAHVLLVGKGMKVAAHRDARLLLFVGNSWAGGEAFELDSDLHNFLSCDIFVHMFQAPTPQLTPVVDNRG